MGYTRRATFATGGAAATAAALALAGCGDSFDDDSSDEESSDLTSSDDALTVLIGSSGDAETASVEAAVAAWSESSGIDASVVAATDLSQELSQGFASGEPADVFYLAPDSMAGYADNGSLKAYGDLLSNKDDFYTSLVDTFTYSGEFYGAPKDSSTLALIINTGMWDDAGLTDDDLPASWDDLASIAATLTSGDRVGLTFSGEYARIGSFMYQAGGTLLNDDQTEAVADSDANVEALEYVKDHLVDGTFAYAADLGAGWGGEAFGKELAAMTVEGNWAIGTFTSDYPDLEYKVVELPSGPDGQGTMLFTNAWGMATDSPNQQAALDLIEYLTSADQQLQFSADFGPMPSVQSAADQWSTDNPDLTAFLTGVDYSTNVPTAAGVSDVVTDFNSQLESLASSDPEDILASVQENLEAAIGD